MVKQRETRTVIRMSGLQQCIAVIRMFIYLLNDFEEKAENYFSFCYVLERCYILFILLLGVGQKHLISSPLLSSDDKKMMKRKKEKRRRKIKVQQTVRGSLLFH